MVISHALTAGGKSRAYRTFGETNVPTDMPDLIQVQKDSFDWLLGDGLHQLFKEISPITDYSSDNPKYEMSLTEHEIGEPEFSEEECREREITYSVPLHVTIELKINETDEIKEQTIFFGDMPKMTENGTFIINGAERVVISQLVRSPGAYYSQDEDPATGNRLCSVKLIPYRGAWVELETSNRDILFAKVDRKRKLPVTTLLRAIAAVEDGSEHDQESPLKLDSLEAMREIFGDPAEGDEDAEVRDFIRSTWESDADAKDEDDALKEFHKRMRPGEPATVDGAKRLVSQMFFDSRRYDLGDVGRYKLNRRIDVDVELTRRTLTKRDFVNIIKRMIKVNEGTAVPDDIDHLGNRRVRTVGELIQNQIRVGLVRMERVVRERMTTHPGETTPAALINIRPVGAAVKEFFGGSQLSQFMDQTNPLSELTHKRRLSALGPGGLTRDRAGFDVRDVHHSHYGRICPIETPEGPNIGLLGSLATYAKVNAFGFVETPYRKVRTSISNRSDDLIGRMLTEDVREKSRKTIVGEADSIIDEDLAKRLRRLGEQQIEVRPFISLNAEDVEYLSADQEEEVLIGEPTTPVDAVGQLEGSVRCRTGGEQYVKARPEDVDYIDVSPSQIVSVSAGLIPFLEHDDATRALMGSNMQRQGVPLIRPEAPIVGTGIEARAALDSGQVVRSSIDGLVASVTSDKIVIADDQGETRAYPLIRYERSNQSTCINQHPIVSKGQRVQAGQAIADSSSTEGGRLALGQNVLVGFMSWGGGNYEDAIILSEDLVKDDRFTSTHIQKHQVEARETQLGPEEITRDIANVGETNLANLDEEGIVIPGTWVGPGDILVGKVTPKGETELTAEEKLLRAIFGEKARDTKDTSLRVPHGEKGKVIKVRVSKKEDGAELPPGVSMMVRVWVAHTRKIMQGDKMAGRHGNKGVVAMILPREDMPHLPDGTPLDIVLNPIGVPSRMNLGQLLETHLGWAARELDFSAITPVFDSATEVAIEDELARAWFVSASEARNHRDITDRSIDQERIRQWLQERGHDYNELSSHDIDDAGKASEACMRLWLSEVAGQDTTALDRNELMAVARRLDRESGNAAPILGKQTLIDGRTGERFDQPVTVGNIYMMKLIHLAEDKMHARSTGPYSLITQQPLGGKAQFGGQRFGEMEVWALEAYSAPHTLQEVLTIKSDDVKGRVLAYEAIVKGQSVVSADVPESFNVLIHELQGLGLDISMIGDANFETGTGDEADEVIEETPFLEDHDLVPIGGDVMDIGAELPPPVLEFDVDFSEDDDQSSESLDEGEADDDSAETDE
ncbi:MAG: DNA-directed RNA polymerase subunit beta [Chloroflexi bacterium]|nr:DNA-directed RNA polymerase subunit beta [Chloroflexota bacterium]